MTNQEKAAAAFRAWVREHVHGKPECRAPDVNRAAIAHFKAIGQWEPLVSEIEWQIGYRLTLEALRAGRVIFADGDAVKLDAQSLTDVADRRGESVFADWREYIGDRHVSLLDMNREQVRQAKEFWAGQVAAARARYDFLAAIEKKMRGAKTVRETFTETQLIRLHGRNAPPSISEAAD